MRLPSSRSESGFDPLARDSERNSEGLRSSSTLGTRHFRSTGLGAGQRSGSLNQDQADESGGRFAGIVDPALLRSGSRAMAVSAICARRALLVYRSTSASDWWPVTDMIWCAVAPRVASLAAAAFRQPCAEQCGSPAWMHHFLNLFPKPFGVKGRP